jgi:hypothetical protein
MAIEQGSLFPDTPDQPAIDLAAAAAHIGEHAPVDPYAEQTARAARIVETRGEDLATEQGHPAGRSAEPAGETPLNEEAETPSIDFEAARIALGPPKTRQQILDDAAARRISYPPPSDVPKYVRLIPRQ